MPGGLPDVEQRFSAESSGYSAAIAAMIRDNEGLIKSIGDAQRKIGELKAGMGGLGDRRVKVEVTGVDEAIGKVAALRKELDGLGDRTVHVGGDNGEMVRHLKDISTYMDIATDSMGRMEEHLFRINKNSEDSSAALDMQTQMLRDNAAAHHAAADAASRFARVGRDGGGGPFGGPLNQAWNSLSDAQRNAYVDAGLGRQGGGGGWQAAAGAAGGGRGGGGWGAAAAGAAAGGGGGGGGGFVPWAGGGWQAVRFWGMMTAEVASTVVPALAAAGSAALVGMQGVQELKTRYQAISTVSSAIGDAFGQSTGSFLGTGTALADAQNAARGGVYELAGAGINMLKSGAGGGFLQQGTNTIAMLDRAVANMSPGLGGRISGALGGGTGYLRQFGDIGANLGNTLLNVAPNLPGIGAGMLGALQGGTGLLATATRDIPAPLLKGFFAYEAASRWGPALLGGQGLIGRMLGLSKIGGLGGLLGKIGMSGAGNALAGLTGPEIGLPVAAITAEFAGLNQLPAGASGIAAGNVRNWQGQVAAGGFAGAWQPLAHALTQATGLGAAAAASAPYAGPSQQQIGSRVGAGLQAAYARSPQAQYAQAAQGFSATMADLIGAGPQLVTALKKAGLKSVSMGDAFQIAQNSLLDLSHAFDSHGNLTKTAKNMLSNYVAAIGPMTQNSGAFGAAVGAQTIMGSSQMQDLSKVNQSMDAMTQIMSGGPAGMANLFGMLGGTPVTARRGGLQLAASPGMKAMAQALTSYTSAGGSAAWRTFAGPQGLVASEQANLDQLRTALTLGGIDQPGAAGLAGFQLQQMLPLAGKSKGALAMLMQQGAQMGVTGYYDPGKSQAQNYKDAVAATAKIADNSRQANAATDNMTVKMSRIPDMARQFSQSMNADVMSQSVAKAATAMNSVIGSAGKGSVNTGGIQAMIAQMKQAGLTAQSIGPVIQNALQHAGVSGAMQKKIMIQVGADTGAAQAKINAVHGKPVTIQAMAAGVAAVQAAINSVHGKSVTIQVTTINTEIFRQIGALTPPGGIAPMTPVGGGANMRIRAGAQTGMKIPGYGGGDIFPALLEPGELVVPKHQVAAGLVDHLRGSIPGFAAGGLAGAYTPLGFASMMTEAFNGPQVRENLRGIIDGLIAAGLPRGGAWLQAQNPRTPLSSGKTGGGGTGTPPGDIIVHPGAPYMPAAHHAAGQFSVEILKGITDGLKNAKPEAAAAARALVAKIGQEIAYAKGTASNMAAGLNFGGMDTTQGPVQTQMQSYADSLKAFSGDIRAMSKGGLNKDLLRQMIAAGPVQGDALAQSIGQGYGGIKAVNSLYASIQGLSKGIGAQAAGAIYGGTLAPNLKSGTFTSNNVSISVNLSGGKGGGDLSLTNAQISQLVALIQKKLLQQAKRNNKTGVKLPGKGA